MTRRLRFRYEQEATVEIDATKWADYFGEEPLPKRAEKSITENITNGEATIDSSAFEFGIEGTYDKYAHTDLDVEIEQQCEKHPNVWFPLEPNRLAYCWQCKSEERERKAKKK